MSTAQVTGAGLDQGTGIDQEPPAAAGIIDSKVGEVSQTQLMYRRFKQSKLAVVSLFILGLLYLVALFAPFLSPNDPVQVDQAYKYAAPSLAHLVRRTGHVHGDAGDRPGQHLDHVRQGLQQPDPAADLRQGLRVQVPRLDPDGATPDRRS